MRFSRHLLVLILASLVLAPLAVIARAPAHAAEVHGLSWGYKASWRAYVGAANTRFSDGARVKDDGTYFFPVAEQSYDKKTNTTRVKFAGTVEFRNYCTDPEKPATCALWTKIKNPEVLLSPEKQTLFAHIISASRAKPGTVTDHGLIPFAGLGLGSAKVVTANGVTSWSGITATLTKEASGDPTSYDVGTRLDDLSFTYAGDGGNPIADEVFDQEGALSLKEAARVSVNREFAGDAGLARPYLSADGKRIHLLGRRSDYGFDYRVTIATFDSTTMRLLSNSTFPTGELSRIAYDQKAESFYFVATVKNKAHLERATWAGGTFASKRLAEVPSSPGGKAPAITYLASNGKSVFLIWTPNRADLKADLKSIRPQVLEWAGGGNLIKKPLPFANEIPGGEGVDPKNVFYSLATNDPDIEDLAVGRVLIFSPNRHPFGLKEPVPVVTVDVAKDKARVRLTGGSAGGLSPIATSGRGVFLYAAGISQAGSQVSSGQVSDAGELVDVATPKVISLNGRTIHQLAPGGVSDDAGHTFIVNPSASEILVLKDGKLVSNIPVSGLSAGTIKFSPLAYAKEKVIAFGFDAKSDSYQLVRVSVVGVTPVFVSGPVSQVVRVGSGLVSGRAVFGVEVVGEGVGLQWQRKLPGESGFSDVRGAVGSSIVVEAGWASDGAEYRVVASNGAGRVVSGVGVLSVEAPPVVEVEPGDVRVREGEVGSFSVMAGGLGRVSYSWQVLLGGKWEKVVAGTDSVYVVDGAVLRVQGRRELDGRRFRVAVSNEFGTTFSNEARLVVEGSSVGGKDPVSFRGVVLEWGGAGEWQARPPNGSEANYFSAGVSDGTQGSYRADGDGVRVVQRDKSGRDSPASWVTRGAHVVGGGNQLVRLVGGVGVVQPDGSAEVGWPKAVFSVNFYDGLVPFTVSNVRLTVGKNGSGRLVGDLSGFAGDMANPNKPKVRAPSRAGVVIAEFENVVVDTKKGFTASPVYRNVVVKVPKGQSPQVRTGDWGSWPQSFVDFQFGTGLAGYFYSTGGSMDPKKSPWPIAVGFSDAVVPTPTPTPTPGPTPTPTPVPVPLPDPGNRVVPGGRVGVEGSLLWGVRSSFRSYITGPIAKGRISVGQGAAASGGLFRFGQQSTDWKAGAVSSVTTYRGLVHFYGHHGVLDLKLSDPQVRIVSASEARLWVRVNGSGHVEFAELDLARASRSGGGDSVSFANVPAKLTVSGAKYFSYGRSEFYKPGEQMDPLSFVIGVAAKPGSAGGGSSSVSGPSRVAGPLGSSPGSVQGPVPAKAVIPPASGQGCAVRDATISWGFKESFRAYISGSIAHGKWDVSDGATYRTPKFGWVNGVGKFDGKSTSGEVGFKGMVRFTGHDGLLNTTVANPRLRFVDGDTAYLLLDVAGVTMEDALAGKKTPVVVKDAPFVKLDLKNKLKVSADKKTVSASDVSTVITREGFTAFPNYNPGTAFDPISFTMGVDEKCEFAGPVAGSQAVPGVAESQAVMPAVSGNGPSPYWLLLAGGGLTILGVGAGTGISVLLNRQSATTKPSMTSGAPS